MKFTLPVRLGIFIALLFGAVITTCLLWTPVRYAWLKSQLLSDDATTREKAVKTLASEGHRSIPYVRRWLLSESDKLVVASCDVLKNMQGGLWDKALPENHSARPYLKGYRCGCFNYPPLQFRLEKQIQEVSPGIEFNFRCYLLLHGTVSARVYAAVYVQKAKCRSGTIDKVNTAMEHDELVEVRKVVAEALGEINSRRAVEPLVKAMKTDNARSVRIQAAESLALIGGNDVIASLVETAFRNSDGHVKAAAQEILAGIGDPCILELFVTELKRTGAGKKPYVHSNRLFALIASAADTDTLITLFEENDDDKILDILGQEFQNRMCSKLLAALNKRFDSEKFHKAVVRAVIQPGGYALWSNLRSDKVLKDPQSVDALLRMLAEIKNSNWHRKVINLLGEIGDRKAVDPLCRLMLSEKGRNLAGCLATALGKIGDPAAIEPLRKSLEFRFCEANSAKALEALGDKSGEEWLLKVLEEDKFVNGARRSLVIRASGSFRSESVFRKLIALLKHEHWVARLESARALGLLQDKRAAEPLLALMKSENNERVKEIVAHTLSLLADKKAVPVLLEQLNGKIGKDLRRSVLNALGEIGDPESLDPLLEMYSRCKNGETIRASITSAIGGIDSPRVPPILIDMLRNDIESKVKYRAALALGNVGGTAEALKLMSILSEPPEKEYLAKRNQFMACPQALVALKLIADPVAVDVLVTVLRNSSRSSYHDAAAEALGAINNVRAIAELKRFFLEGHRTKEPLALIAKILFEQGDPEIIRHLIDCYENKAGFDRVAMRPHGEGPYAYMPPDMGKTLFKLWKRVPGTFPRVGPAAPSRTRKLQCKRMRKWLEENRDRLAWDAEKKIYYLKTENIGK